MALGAHPLPLPDTNVVNGRRKVRLPFQAQMPMPLPKSGPTPLTAIWPRLLTAHAPVLSLKSLYGKKVNPRVVWYLNAWGNDWFCDHVPTISAKSFNAAT